MADVTLAEQAEACEYTLGRPRSWPIAEQQQRMIAAATTLRALEAKDQSKGGDAIARDDVLSDEIAGDAHPHKHAPQDGLVAEIDPYAARYPSTFPAAEDERLLQRARDRIVELGKTLDHWNAYGKLVSEQKEELRLRIIKRETRISALEQALREIAQRLDSAAAEVDCFNVYESRDVAKRALDGAQSTER